MSDEQTAAHFTALYRENYGRVLRFVSRRLIPGVEAEDVAADVFRIAWTETSRGVVISPGWLFVTAQNTLRNQRRSMQRADRLYDAVGQDLSSHLATHSASGPVHHALDRLRDTDREILVLRYWDELGAREIAEVLNVSVSAVWVRLHRARRAFQNIFTGTSGGQRAVR